MVSLKNLPKAPYGTELKDMIITLNSLRESNGLWGSKLNPELDLYISSSILWFVSEAYRKYGLTNDLKYMCNALKNFIFLKLSDIEQLEVVRGRDLQEILQCFVTLFSNCNLDTYAKNKIYDYSLKIKQIIISKYKINPFEHNIFSLYVILVALFHKDAINMFTISMEYLNLLMTQRINTKDVRTSALYWVTEALKIISKKIEKLSEYYEKIIPALKSIESFVISKVINCLNYKENYHPSLSEIIWTYLCLENIYDIYNNLRIEIKKDIKKDLNLMIKLILSIGWIYWSENSYSRFLQEIRESTKFSYLCINETNKRYSSIDIDLITLSILIHAYTRIGKHLITYVTEFERREFKKLHRLSFVVGSSIIFFSSFITGYILHMQSLNIFNLPLVIALLLFMSSGYEILYKLSKNEIQSDRDLLNILKMKFPFISAVVALISYIILQIVQIFIL